VYFGAVEIRNWQIAGQEQVVTYPHPAVRLVNGSTITAASYLHRDALGSVRAITDAAGVKVESAFYKPFGEQTEWLSPAAPAPEAKGWIGERFDASAGLQYLNARYYDPELGMFIQPDWFEVTRPGVGRNRYSYSFNDPVNGRDPGGNNALAIPIAEAIETLLAALYAAVFVDHVADTSDDGVRNGSSGVLNGLAGLGHNGGPGFENNDNEPPEENDPVAKMLAIAAATSTAKIDLGQSASPRNYPEKLAVEAVNADPSIGRLVRNANNDPTFSSEQGWQKMEYVLESQSGGKITVHYQVNANKAPGQAFDVKVVHSTFEGFFR
jgi:RHS repeat-associated protein